MVAGQKGETDHVLELRREYDRSTGEAMNKARASVLLLSLGLGLIASVVPKLPRKPTSGIEHVTAEVVLKGAGFIPRGSAIDIYGYVQDGTTFRYIVWLRSLHVVDFERQHLTDPARITLEVTGDQAEMLRYAKQRGSLYPVLLTLEESRARTRPRRVTTLGDLLRSSEVRD